MTRNCIIVSPYFPPSTLAGVHRARHLAKHLPAAGWQPIVVCVDETHHEEKLDPGLANLVPASVEIVKVAALSPRVCRPLGLGEISVRAWRSLRAAVLRLIETRNIEAVLITGSPYYPMLLAAEIKRRGVPIVLDFQDPWVSAWGATQPRFSKVGAAHRLAILLEPKAVAAADYITSVSETQNAEMRARYPDFPADRMAAIPIGGDPEDYDALRRAPPPRDLLSPEQWHGQLTLAYVGTMMPGTLPLMDVFMAAFANARKREQALSNVRLLFVGTSNQPNDTTTYSVLPIARKHGIQTNINETPQRVPYLDALAVLARSHGVLLIGSVERHYTASKIYPGLMSGRPYLSVFHRESSSHEILSRAGGGIALGFAGQDSLADVEQPLADALVRLVTTPEDFGRADPAAYAAYEARAIAAQYAAIFDRLAGHRRSEASDTMLKAV